MHNHSYDGEFNLHVNEISFAHERMSTTTMRFKEIRKWPIFGLGEIRGVWSVENVVCREFRV